VRDKLDELFGADLRALAALRMGLALTILIDLVQRSSDLVVHYTDAGLLPRADLLRVTGRRTLVSIHLLSGAWQWEAALFVVAGVCAVALLVGYRTRLATVATWFLLISLNARNPMVVLGGDSLLRIVLFWAMFLPLGAYYSVDRAAGRIPAPPRSRVLSAATVAFLVQIVLMYWVTALRKYDPEWRTEGTALYYALSLEHLTTPLGHFLLGFPALLKPLTHGVFWLELIGPILLFSPVLTTPIRSLTILAFVIFQLGIALTLRIGLFPWVSVLVMVVFVPSSIWDVLTRHRPRESPAAPPLTSSAGHPLRARILGAGVGALLLYVLVWNVTSLPRAPFRAGEAFQRIGYLLRVDQTWNMFAPSPSKDDGWYVIPGRLRDGSMVDLFRNGSDVRWDKPERGARRFPNSRWRRYMMLLPNHLDYAPSYARYLCRSWNRTHDGGRALEALEIVFVVERTLPDARKSDPRRQSVHRHTCGESSSDGRL
jgi:hypothetical protein